MDSQDQLTTTTIAIIGAGFAGLGMAIRLRQQGIEDFLIFERAAEVGGVWRDNVYPGCACDVESHLYSLSFAPNPRWSRSYSGQREIQDYLQVCATEFGIYPFIRFGHSLEAAHWDSERRLWRIETSQGIYLAQVLISATGAFSEARVPDLPGLENFAGKVFHSANWDPDYDLRGKHVAVIGTGASAIQFVPAIQPQVARLYLFQRTPAWVMPRLDRALTPREKTLYQRFPLLQRLARLRIYLVRELFGMSFRHPGWMTLNRSLALRHLHGAITDPELRAKLTPAYTIGCKRILISNDYYPALAQPNVEVLTEPVKGFAPQAILSPDGQERPIDALIFGTGFQVTDYVITRSIFGRGGQSLASIWNGSPEAYLGTMIPDFPNLFFLLGPNTGLGHNSVVLMIEAQIEFVLKALGHLRKSKLGTLEPRPDQHRAFINELDARSQRTVWLSGGCRSWYLDSKGRNSTLWPRSVGSFRRRLKAFDPQDFLFTPQA